MKKLIILLIATLLSFNGFAQHTVSPGFGQGKVAEAQSRVLTDGGDIYPNCTPARLDEMKRADIYDKAVLIIDINSANDTTLYATSDTSTGDLDFRRTTVKSTIDSKGFVKNVPANYPAINFSDGCPYIDPEDATTELIAYPEHFTKATYWTVSGCSVIGDITTAGAELTTNGSFTGSATGWTLDSDWDYGSNNVVYTYSAGGNQDLDQFSFIEVGKTYLFEYTISGSSGFTGTLRLLSALDFINLSEVDGTYSFQFTANSTGINVRAQATAGTISIDNISVKQVSGFSSPSVDGYEAFKLVSSSANGYIQLATPLTITSGLDYANSIWVKRVTGTGNVLIKDINNAETTITTTNYWQRFDVVSTSSSTSGQLGIKLATSGDEVMIAFANTTQTDYAHNLIYAGVEGSTITTASDQINASGTAAMFQNVNSSGTMSLEIAAHSDDLTERVIALSDGTTDNCVRLYYSSTTNQIVGDVYVGAALQAQMTYTLTDETDFYDCTIRWKEDDFSLWVEGVEVDTDVSGSTFGASTLTTFAFDDGAGANDFYGKFKRGFVSEEINDTQAATLK